MNLRDCFKPIGLRSYQDIPERDCLPRHQEMLCEQCGEDIENIDRATEIAAARAAIARAKGE